MLEREFQAWIVGVAKRYGWHVYHSPMPMRPAGKGKFVPDSRGAGLPDLILFHEDPPRMIFAEVKVDSELSEKQREFLRLARGVHDGLDDHWRAIAAALGLTVSDDVAWTNPVGVYVWRPGVEALIESVLRGTVMV